ncbi:MAG: class I SAM-dependent methyltransferase [Acidobacteria bacterium]|nr:class I SAM-dependent methyltransferase [Acidobacteriota bacterium]
MTVRHFYPLLGFLIPTVIMGYGVVIPRSCIAGLNESSVGFGMSLLGACLAYWQGVRAALRGSNKRLKGVVRRPEFLARQARHPTGLLGALVGWIMSFETASENRMALWLLRLRPRDHILEIGFGHGRTIARAAGLAPLGKISGVEVSEQMAKMASRRNRRLIAAGRVDLRVSQDGRLPFPDQSFDKVYSVHTLYFWEDPAAQLCEIKRVMKPGACFALGFRPRDEQTQASFPDSVYRLHSLTEVQSLLVQAGFQDVRPESAPSSKGRVVFVLGTH